MAWLRLMGDGRHGRVHIAAGTCALLQPGVDCCYTTTAWMPEGRVGRAVAGPRVFVVGVGVSVNVCVGCEESVLRLSFLAIAGLHGSPR